MVATKERFTGGGEDVISSEDSRLIETLRERGMNRVNAMISSAPNVFTRRDADIYKEDFSESGMRKWGYVTAKQQIESLQDLLNKNIPEMERRSRETERKFRGKIENAIGKKWIGRRSAARWMQRLAAENAYYWQKEMFVDNPEKFAKYLKNWERVATERKKIMENPMVKNLSGKDVKGLSIFKNEEDFLNRPFEERENLLAAMQGALAAKARQMPQLHAKAKSMLEAAADSNALSHSKVGVWLGRIFKSGANAELIEQFINGNGSAVIAGQKMTLGRLISNWSQASQHFTEIENKRKTLGTPRGFNFVSMTVFLNWDFERRKAYNQEANNRFKGMPKADVILKIRHELDTKDWESADSMIKQAKGQNLSKEDAEQLKHLEKFHREHSLREPMVKGGESKDPADVLHKLDACLEMIPQQLRKIYKRSLRNGYQAFWATTVLMYNRVWCHQHGFYDENKEKVMEKQAKDPTRDYIREGHGESHEVTVVKDDTNEKGAIRKQAGIKKAQIMFTNERSEETLTTEINEQKNTRDFWYWTSMIPEGVSYAEHLFVVTNIHPQMKKLARQLESMGARYPAGGDGAMMAAPKNARTAKPSMN